MNFTLALVLVLLGVLPILWGTVIQRTESREKRSVLFNGWQYRAPLNQYFFPRTENYYHQIKPEAIVEIIVDPTAEDVPLSPSIVEHSSITTSVHSHAEYKSSCTKEPGCRWECEPRQDELPPDCDCVCFYTDAKWDSMV